MKTRALFVFFFAGCFLPAAGAYFLLGRVMSGGPVFGSLYRMVGYHHDHPLQYIALVALVYAVIATLCARRWSGADGKRRAIFILTIMAATIVISSVPGGVLWKIHDMQAGFFPRGWRFFKDLAWGAAMGMSAGWLVVAASFPYNLIGLAAGYFVTRRGFELARGGAEGIK